MNPERWQQIERIYNLALELDTGQRAGFIEGACANDASLRKEVEPLLARQSQADNFIESPAIEIAAQALARDQQPRTDTDLVGRTRLHYQITGRIGEGGMGVVYRAQDTNVGVRSADTGTPEQPVELTQPPLSGGRGGVIARSRARASYPEYPPNSTAAKGRMKRRIQIIAGTCLLFSLAVCLQCSWAVAQSKEQVSSKHQKWSLDRPAEAEVVFGKNDKYSAVLLCCWHILVYEQRGDRQVIIWDWDKFDGAVGEKDDLLVRDVDEDGNEEVVFQISKLNFCLTENAAVLYSPEKRIVFLLKYDGDTALRLSPNLKDNQKVREWLVKYWQERRRVDLNKITVTYDAEP